MGKSLVIVESPAKAKTINKILGKDFVVKASVGHVVDLPSNKLGVDVEKDFKPEYITIKGKHKVLKEIKLAAKDADKIYLAPDPDREGEAISWHIARKLGVKEERIFRLLFSEITKTGIRSALAKSTRIDIDKVNAQQARRILDRLVGYKISPLLWKKVRRGLSAGRVQSVALRLICEREDEIKKFVSDEYWSVIASLFGDAKKLFSAKLHFISGKLAKLSNEKVTSTLVNKLKNSSYVVSSVKEKEAVRRPTPPFITSTLQQEAARKMSFTSKRTMGVAQSLYEGVDIGKEGTVGLITYMRTDSTRIADEAQKEAKKYIAAKFGTQYIPKSPHKYKNKKGAQDAHEAVRPTSVYHTPEFLEPFLKSEQLRLYKLIWKRFLASQMSVAKILQTSVDIKAEDCVFRATGSVIKFDGFMHLYMEGKDDTQEDENGSSKDGDKLLPAIKKDEVLELKKLEPKQHFTQPPPRYTEATLVKTLEEKGIGRPSTYAAIITTILAREYVVKDKKQIVPTELGELINELLVSSFPEILNVKFTAKMESDLDLIEEGKLCWVDSLREFYSPFSAVLKEAEANMKSLKEPKATDIDCPKCGGKLAIKWGKNGRFLACSSYPKCKATMEFETDDKGKIRIVQEESVDKECKICGLPMLVKKGRFGKFLACTDYPDCKSTMPLDDAEELEPEIQKLLDEEKCTKCGSDMVLKRGRFGRFLACGNYPKCKNAKPISLGIFCPNDGCSGFLTERTGKRGKPFYGCSNYPKCKYVAWDKPVKTPCPTCGAQFLLQIKKGEESFKKCSSKSCDYTLTD